MNHIDSGLLRRMIDQPNPRAQEERAHLEACGECRERAALIARDAEHAARVLGGEPSADPSRAYARVSERLARRGPSASFLPLWGGALAAAFALALFVTPLGGYARSFLTIFQPQQFKPIAISRADLRNLRLLPQADDVGTQRVVLKPEVTAYPSLAAAQKHAAFPLLHPTVLPAKFGSVRTYQVSSPGEMAFTFSAAKAAAFEKRAHKRLPPMPAGLNGTTVTLHVGQTFHAHYEQTPAGAKNAAGAASFELIEAQAPRVSSTGASLEQLERYLLSMPNVSPRLAQEIRALGDVQNTVPVPVVIDKQIARSVAVHGVRGFAVGDNTGMGAGVMWQKDGRVYVVGGPLSMDDVLKIANGLR